MFRKTFKFLCQIKVTFNILMEATNAVKIYRFIITRRNSNLKNQNDQNES
jgi:hypothetical protein